ncbi:MAG: serine/threonine-protein kinase [Solirubrobacterales bacterium]
MSEELVMGRFRVEERIGSGGMGTVYRAFDERLQRDVALKEIQTAGAERVLREAQAAARLNHPAIVTLYELGERDGHALLVSELVPGQTLDRVASEGAVSDRDVAEIGTDLCDALAHAHERGVIHRDVKPQNAIVRPFGTQGRRAKLMDFGIAAVAGAPALTSPGEVVGTLAYMAPEQAEGEHAGPEADVYSLALTLFEAWAGENPVARRTPAQTARQIGQPLPSLGLMRPDLPNALVAQIDASLVADPRNRPSIKRLRSELARVAPQLDDECAVPSPDGSDSPLPRRSFARVLGFVGAGTALAALAGPAGLPGLALVLAAVLLPAVATATSAGHALLPLAAAPLGAAGAIAAAPALIAFWGRNARERAVLGALSFAVYLLSAVGFGFGDRLGIAPKASEGWTKSAETAGSDVLGAFTDLSALGGLGLLAAAAVLLGVILRAQAALALVGTILWAAALATGLAYVGDGSQSASAAVAVVIVSLAVVARTGARHHGKPVRPRPLASAQPALHGGGPSLSSL